MSKRRKSIKGTPPTSEETTGITKPLAGRPIICSICHKPGGTLIKNDGGYQHMDKAKCGIMAMARPTPSKEV